MWGHQKAGFLIKTIAHTCTETVQICKCQNRMWRDWGVFTKKVYLCIQSDSCQKGEFPAFSRLLPLFSHAFISPNEGHISFLLLPYTDFVYLLVLYGIVIVCIYSAQLHCCLAGFVRFCHIVCSGSLFVSLLIGCYCASSTMGDGHLIASRFWLTLNYCQHSSTHLLEYMCAHFCCIQE